MDQKPYFPGDITCEEVAGAGSLSIKKVRPFYVPETDKAFADELKRRLEPEIPVIESVLP